VARATIDPVTWTLDKGHLYSGGARYVPLKLRAVTDSSGAMHQLGKFTILVGPNNCGKSQTLRDIRDYITTGSNKRLVVLRDADVEVPEVSEIASGIHVSPHQSPGHTHLRGVSFDLRSVHEFAPSENWLEKQVASAKKSLESRSQLLQHIGNYLVAHLDAESRFILASRTSSYDTRREWPSNALQAFFSRRSEVLPELRTAFREAFDMDIALDWAAMKTLSFKVGRDFGTIPETLSDLDLLLSDKQELAAQGDGYRSFAGVVLAMLTFPDRLLLLDEPEAFLHPAQARALGRWLAKYAAKRSAQVILATHSAEFLWGAVSANRDTAVVRLNRSETTTSFHFVSSSTVAGLAQSPLLSSQPVLDALFQRGVCVCEGDPDRAIYQAVAHIGPGAERGAEVLFIHTNGKDAIDAPVKLLREAGTPVCAIVDIDILNSEDVFMNIVNSLSDLDTSELRNTLTKIASLVEATSREDLLNNLKAAVTDWQKVTYTDLRRARRALVAAAKGASKWDAVKKKGLDFFPGPTRSTVEEFLKGCTAHGMFVVPRGELEGWLRVGVAKGRTWNRRALEQLYSSGPPPELQEFVQKVVQYLEPSRGKPTNSLPT
jgi:ABC-type cobalamin/Fe3+-siderophores transport system ATPase subunit